MKAFPPILAFLATLSFLVATEKGADSSDSETETGKSKSPHLPSVFTFADGTRMSGFPKSIDGPKQLLKIQLDSHPGESLLKAGQLLEMTRQGDPQEVDFDSNAVVTVKNHFHHNFHDSIHGQLVQMDDKKIVLDTWYAGRLTMRRSLIKSLDIYRRAPTIYVGPNGPEGWVSAGGDLPKNWTFKNRSMVSKGRVGIAREVKIPQKAKIAFTADWETTPYFRVLFFSNDGTKSYPTSGYSLNVQRSYLSLYRSSPSAGSEDIISEAIRSLYNAEKAEFTLYLDRSKDGTSAIYLDDTEIGTWTGVDDTAPQGNWLHFVPQNENSIRFREISVRPWNGVLPQAPGKDDDAKKDAQPNIPQGTEILFTDGKKVKDDIALITTVSGQMKVPTKSIQGINLNTQNDQVQMKSNDVRAWFHQGGYITISLKSLNKTTLTGSSSVWGEASFDLKAFSRIEFNIWSPALDAARDKLENGW